MEKEAMEHLINCRIVTLEKAQIGYTFQHNEKSDCQTKRRCSVFSAE